MKIGLFFCRWIVGILFIFSGLIKVNDPLGLSFKMQEFFEVWGLHFLNDYTLAFAILMNMFEVFAGIALLLGWQMKWISKLLLLLILFFTFLTGYALFSGKIKTCGCFGDCIPLTAKQSFIKDILLLILITIITVQYKKIKLVTSVPKTLTLLAVSIAITGFLQFFVLQYLPIIDCLPYKIGNNILDEMKPDKNYIPDSTTITYQYKKGDSIIEFSADEFPPQFDSSYIYLNRFDKLIRKGSGAPKITDFTLLSTNGTDTTTAIFTNTKSIWIMANNYPTNNNNWLEEMKQVNEICKKKNLNIYYITSQTDEDIQQIKNVGITILKCDATVIKTAARVNSTYFFMNKATIKNKMSCYNTASIKKALQDF